MIISELYKVYDATAGVSIDTRTLRPGQLFFALGGENVDGSVYALKALELGAPAAVVRSDASGLPEDARIIRVPDPFKTLRELAIYHRGRLGFPIIGLTGTNGKTTTKELIRAALSAGLKVGATEGNFNNDIGVPLTVLSFPTDLEIAIVEMGASHPDDLKPLLEVAQPNYGLITNVGRAHLEGFGSFEGVKYAKGLLYDYLIKTGGEIFVNDDDETLLEMLRSRGAEGLGYGASTMQAKVLPASGEKPWLRMVVSGKEIDTNLVGAYNSVNVLAALRVATRFGVPFEKAAAAVSAYVPKNNRSQFVHTEKNYLIEDYYNANPSSMGVALDNLSLIEGPKAALLGDMRELGEYSLQEHTKIVERLLAMDLKTVCLVGDEFTKAAAALNEAPALPEDGAPASPLALAGSTLQTFPTSDALAAHLHQHPIQGCTILVKGSRGIRMEKVIGEL